MTQAEIVTKLKQRIDDELSKEVKIANAAELLEKTCTIAGINLVLNSIFNNPSETFKFFAETVMDDPPLRSDIDEMFK